MPYKMKRKIIKKKIASRASFCASLGLLLFSCSVFAQSAPSTPSLTQSLLQVFGALILVISLIFGAAWLAKRLKLTSSVYGQQIKALSALPLGRKEKVVLIESCGKKLLIGVSANAINVLHVFDESDEETGTSAISENPTDDPLLFSKSASALIPANVEQNKTSRTKEFSRFLNAVMSGRKNAD